MNIGELILVNEGVVVSDPRRLTGSILSIDEENQLFEIIIDVDLCTGHYDDLKRIVPMDPSGWIKI